MPVSNYDVYIRHAPNETLVVVYELLDTHCELQTRILGQVGKEDLRQLAVDQ